MTNINRCWLLMGIDDQPIAVYTTEEKGKSAVEYFLKDDPGYYLKEIYIYS